VTEFYTHKAILEEYIVVLDALLTQPTVKGTYGMVPPQENPTHPFFLGDIICKTVSNGAALVLGSAMPNVMPLAPIHPE
jgi:hypothetical protein